MLMLQMLCCLLMVLLTDYTNILCVCCKWLMMMVATMMKMFNSQSFIRTCCNLKIKIITNIQFISFLFLLCCCLILFFIYYLLVGWFLSCKTFNVLHYHHSHQLHCNLHHQHPQLFINFILILFLIFLLKKMAALNFAGWLFHCNIKAALELSFYYCWRCCFSCHHQHSSSSSSSTTTLTWEYKRTAAATLRNTSSEIVVTYEKKERKVSHVLLQIPSNVKDFLLFIYFYIIFLFAVF